MTVKEAFETILDGSYSVLIDNVCYETFDDIPEMLLEKDIKVIRPRNGQYEAYYKIKI